MLARSSALLFVLAPIIACSRPAGMPTVTGRGGTGGGDAGRGAVDAGSDGVAGAGGAGAAGAGVADAGGRGVAGAGVSTTVTFTETTEAFRNPMKGFRPSRYIQDASFKAHEYASTYKHYIPYASLEGSASDSAQKIKDWSDANWSGLRGHNLKVIPRVVIVYPGTGEFWGDLPHDGTPDQWNTAALRGTTPADQSLTPFDALKGDDSLSY